MGSESVRPSGTLVDSNVLLDLVIEDSEWFEWSSAMLEKVADDGPLVINPLIFAEVSVRFPTIEEVEEVFPTDFFVRMPLPWSAAFLAAKCYLNYRKKGGEKRSPLPDFYIGAHAAVSRLRLLTRDARCYRTYFPTVELIAPA